MLESQGLRPFDPYRTLQLHPHAPRQLIVEAYWRLVARQKQRVASAATEDTIDGLNAAYGLLIDDAARSAHDEAHGLTALEPPQVRISRKRMGLPGFGNTVTTVTSHSDYYHLLRVDRDADAEIVDVAHGVLSRGANGHSVEDGFLRDLLDEAYHTLRNPQLRAQYDASLEVKAPPGAPVPPVPALLQPAGHEQPAEAASTPPDAGPAQGRAGAATNGRTEENPAALRPHRNGRAPLPEFFRRSASPGAPQSPASANGANSAAHHGQRTRKVPSPDPVAASASVAVGTRPSWLLRRMRLRQERAPEAQVARTPPASPPQSAVGTPGVEAARDERLLALRLPEEAPAKPEAATGHLPEGGAGSAELVFVAGPFTGARVPLGEHALTLGSSMAADIALPGPAGRIAPEHARIWQHGDHFVFRQLDGDHTEISGRRLMLPLVMLEDGDDIQIGPHRMRFSISRRAEM